MRLALGSASLIRTSEVFPAAQTLPASHVRRDDRGRDGACPAGTHRDLEQDVRMHIQRFLLLFSVGAAIGSGLPSCKGAAALFRRDFISIQTSTATVMAVSTRTTIVSIFKGSS
jgi:hypothetical protein